MPSPSAYEQLHARCREVALLGSSAQLLQWDQETMMPPRALDWRAAQLSHLGGLTHRRFAAPEIGAWLAACEDHGGFAADSAEAVNVARWRRAYDRATKIPAELVEETEHAKALAREAWASARQRSDFALFRPHLARILGLTRRFADHWGYEEEPYDALLETYEPGARSRALAALFAALRPALVALLGPAAERSARVAPDLLRGHYPVPRQEAFNREVAAAFGFDFAAGRLDVTAHPFCTGVGPGDCRLTTRYDETDFLSSFYSVLHETGHGLYEQGLDPAAFGTPAGEAVSLGIHESQSRLWENQVGRARSFWEHWLSRAARHFPDLSRHDPEEVWAVANRVRPSFIRTEADQLTYDLHVILRFELERSLLNQELPAADVPAAWNERFARLFGLQVPDDARGCLQDVHWSEGLIGYFPTYTLGNVNAAQLFAQARRDRPHLEAELRGGRYDALLGWLRENVHRQGQRHLAPALIERITGRPTQVDDYLSELRLKFE